MSNAKLEKMWTQWYPEKIYFKNIKNQKEMLNYSDKFTEEDFSETLQENISHQKRNVVLEDTLEDTNEKQIKSYEDGFNEGFKKAQKENLMLKNRLDSFFLEFEKEFSIFEKKLYSRLLKIVLLASSYVIGKESNLDHSVLVNRIKKIIHQEGTSLKKPQLFIHPDNRILIETTFQDILQNYKWKLICDKNIDLNGCKIKSENGDIDATVNARWQELYRFVYSEEY